MDAILTVLFVFAVVGVAVYALTRKPKSAGSIRPGGPKSPARTRGED